MKTLSILIFGAFLATSCAHFGGEKSCCETKTCKDGSCEMKKKKHEHACNDGNCKIKKKHKHPCLDGQCPLKS